MYFLPAPGAILDEKYLLERELGTGSMGAVFLATHLGTTRPVAVKVISPKLADHDEFALRFRREAAAAGRLRHPNVINVTDFGVTRSTGYELAYLVMEYVEGQTLSKRQQANPRLLVPVVLDIINQVALALDAAHAAGIVHRDLKPSNIWLETNHRGAYNVKVLDFGIAKVINPGGIGPDSDGTYVAAAPEQAKDDETVVVGQLGGRTTEGRTGSQELETTVGSILGTPAYMSPEQCQGNIVDHRSDIYSLAVIAYELLCGVQPFEAPDTQRLMRMHIEAQPVSPRTRNRSLPSAVADVVLSGMEKEPSKRPRTAGGFAARLRGAAEHEQYLASKARRLLVSHLDCFVFFLVFTMVALSLAFPVIILLEALLPGKLAPIIDGLMFLGIALVCFDLHKAACMLVLERAVKEGKFRPAPITVLKGLMRRLPSFLRTELTSLCDLRPGAVRENLLWPVIWAIENRSGSDAIARSRYLCSVLPSVCTGLLVRQYSTILIVALLTPLAKLMGANDILDYFTIGAGVVLIFAFMFLGINYPLLYWFGLRCQSECDEPVLPESGAKKLTRKFLLNLSSDVLFVSVVAVLMLILIIVLSLLH